MFILLIFNIHEGVDIIVPIWDCFFFVVLFDFAIVILFIYFRRLCLLHKLLHESHRENHIKVNSENRQETQETNELQVQHINMFLYFIWNIWLQSRFLSLVFARLFHYDSKRFQ